MDSIDSIFTAVIIVIVVIWMVAQDSKKETKKEKIGDAVGIIAQSTANKIAEIANSIVEPEDKKKIREAEQILARRNWSLYNVDEYSASKEYIKQLLTVDDSFKKALDTLGLSAERWKEFGIHILYVGVIKNLSRDSFDHSKKNSEQIRRHIINDWCNGSLLEDDCEILKKALSYFHISEDEWIKYGDTVIEMYNVNDIRDMDKYGLIL